MKAEKETQSNLRIIAINELITIHSNKLLGEKLYSLNSTYNFSALKNLQFRFQEKNLNLNRDSEIRGSNPGSGSDFSLEI